jgi:non-haem Fe2+, alpha-ketoglutarate-dependent halogenase
VTTLTRRPDPADFTGRDLSFRPADETAARTLRTDQVGAYNTQGFVSGIDVFTEGEMADIRAYIDDLLVSVLASADGRDSYSITNYHPVCAGLWDILSEPRILALVRDIVGPEAVCWGTHLFAKLPVDGKHVPFHQDAVYWPFEPAHTVTVWLAIDDVDGDNAPVQFVPESHLGGPIAHEALAPDGSLVLARRATGMDARPERFANVLRAGQVSLHSDLLLHGSDANQSNRRRAGLTMRYAAADVRLLDGYDEWRGDAVHVLDGDPSGFWEDRPRPGGERPDLMGTNPIDAS